jgi:hypothetical protein
MTVIEKTVSFGKARKLEQLLRAAEQPVPGRIPRVARLMALAIQYDALLRTGVVQSLAELAELGHVSRTRMTHIMNLLLLAPEIQAWLLFLPPVEQGRDPVFLKDLQPVARQASWKTQWEKVGGLFGI